MQLKAVALKKTYLLGETEINALNGVNVSFQAGTFYAVIGKSGSGKSTLLHLLSGLDQPTSGRVMLDGVDISALSDKQISAVKRKNFGFVFQSYNLLPELCVLENVLLPAFLDNVRPAPAYLRKVMMSLGIDQLTRKYPAQLSGGEQQRVAIARALVNQPNIIFADEPTGNLDQANSREVLRLLKYTSQKFQQTLILVTHDRDIAGQADIIIRLQDGKIAGKRRGAQSHAEKAHPQRNKKK